MRAGILHIETSIEETLVALLLIGLNHRTTPVEIREQFYLRANEIYPVLKELRQSSRVIHEDAIVSTCNRLEVYTYVTDVREAEQAIIGFLSEMIRIPAEQLRTHLYSLQDELAIEHLMRVSSGLDSMVLGEAQILGQISTAMQCATTAQTSGTMLHRLFESALHAGKRARTETAISRHTTSVSHAAAQLVRMHFGNQRPRVLIIGAGEMAKLAAQAMSDYEPAELAIINRTYRNAQELADTVEGRAYAWSHLWELLQSVDAVISATGAPHTVLYATDMRRVVQQRAGRPLMMVDVAVPRDIDPDVDDLPCLTVHDIDALNSVVDESIAQRRACVPQVENIIREEVENYQQWRNERSVVPLIKSLRDEVSAVVQNELSDALQKLDHLPDYEKQVVERMAHRIMNKVLHHPTATLRQHASQKDTQEFADVVRELFALREEVMM